MHTQHPAPSVAVIVGHRLLSVVCHAICVPCCVGLAYFLWVRPPPCFSLSRSRCDGDNVMAQRNYPCDNIVNVYFGDSEAELNAV